MTLMLLTLHTSHRTNFTSPHPAPPGAGHTGAAKRIGGLCMSCVQEELPQTEAGPGCLGAKPFAEHSK